MNKKYSNYQDVGQKWVDCIPEHWKMKRLKAVFSIRKERNDPVLTENILSLTAKQGVIPYGEKESSGGNKPKSDLTKYNVAHENDLLVNCMNIVSGAAGVSRYYGAVSPVYYPLVPRNDENVWYYHNVFRLVTFQRSLIGLGKGILMHESENGTLTSVRMRISMDYLGGVLLPVPPRNEQDIIVKYLDWQVSKINRLIANKKRKIKVLKEYRKATIDEGVLHGFRDTDKKDSEIYWLGEIPRSWEITPVKRICRVNASITEAAKCKQDNELVTFLPMENVTVNGEVDCSIKKPIGEVRSGYSSFAKGDVVVAKITPCFENGKGACLNCLDTEIGYGTTEFINLRPSEKVLAQYLYLITMTQPFRKLGEEVMSGSAGQKRVPVEFIKNFTLGIPSVKEQEEIIMELESKLHDIDMLIAKEKETIDTLHELRNKLVSDVVTGQVDVRDIEVPEFEYVEEIEDSSEDDEETDDEAVDEEV